MIRGSIQQHVDAILLLSGGIDSTTALTLLQAEGKRVACVTFDYGQTLIDEVTVARHNAAEAGADLLEVCLPFYKGGALVDGDGEIPTGRAVADIAGAGTPPTYVPFRNGVFLAWVLSLGEALEVEEIVAGCNGLASGNYYDDTQEFGDAIEKAAAVGSAPSYRPTVRLPWARMTKRDVVAKGIELGVDYARTLSCYLPTAVGSHCGRCDSCAQRLAAFAPHNLNLHGRPS